MSISNEQEIEKEINIDDIKDKIGWIQSLSTTEGLLESPININLSIAIPIQMTPLKWHHFEVPCKKMKMSNSGHTLIISAKWFEERPFISKGPFVESYIFSQLHFHWGCNDMEGSEHTIDGSQLPLEMHAVYFNSIYLTQEDALREKDGVTVLVYFFQLQTQSNPAIQILIDAMLFVQKPQSSIRLASLPLQFLLKEFIDDYFMYWGSVTADTFMYTILWLITRQPMGISIEQVECFRTLLDTNEEPLIRNFRKVQPQGKRRLFHVTPCSSKYSTLLPTAVEIAESQNNPTQKC